MAPSSTASVRAAEAPLHLLLVEDDEGDAFLVCELLQEEDPQHRRAPRRGRSRRRSSRSRPRSADCVLLDLGLPDASGLGALERLRAAAPRRRAPRAHRRPRRPARHRGGRRRRAGLPRSRAASTATACAARSSTPSSAARPTASASGCARPRSWPRRPRAWSAGCSRCRSSTTGRCASGTGYRPGRERTLLGGDFYDAVRDARRQRAPRDRRRRGHGARRGGARRLPARRVADADARRGGTRARSCPTLQRVLVHERYAEEIFATVLDGRSSPRTAARRAVRSAGHPPPVLLGERRAARARRAPGPAARRASTTPRWPARSLALPHRAGACCCRPTA